METNKEGALVAKTNQKTNPFAKPTPIVGIVHRMNNPLEVICDCGKKGGFKFQLKGDDLLKTLEMVVLHYEELPDTWLFPKVYKKHQNWAILFGISKFDGKEYFVQMLIKGESRDRFANELFKIETNECRLIDTKFKMSFEDKTSSKGEPYKVVNFETENVQDAEFEVRVAKFVEDNGGFEDVCKSTFLDNILKNAPVVFGVENDAYEGIMPERNLTGRIRAEVQN